MTDRSRSKIINDIISACDENYDLRLKDVIKLISGYSVIPFNRENSDDLAVLENLKKAANIAVERIREKKIITKRANEVGNKIEAFVREALCAVGYDAQIPSTSKGIHRSAGYPDIVFMDRFDRTIVTYLECKTYNIQNINTTQRSFYLSPSDDFKIIADAHHFVISIEIIEEGREKDNNIYSAKGWKILDVSELRMSLKLEFNSNNKEMYRRENNFILAESDR